MAKKKTGLALVAEGEIKKPIRIEYALQRPHNRKPLPLIIYLHGAQERGYSVQSLFRHSIYNAIPDKFEFAVVTPQCAVDGIWEPDSIVFMLDEILHTPIFLIDPEKIYLTGFSMGARGTWDVATAYPDRFTAIAPIAGFSCYLKADKIAYMPTWAFHGKEDTLVPVEESMKMIIKMRESGGEPKLSTFSGGHGDGVDYIYSQDFLYEWFLKHTGLYTPSKLRKLPNKDKHEQGSR
jgi:predicted peptidase